MANIIEFNEFAPAAHGSASELCCWLCQKTVTARALFCHHCGTIQPVRDIDHFTRLGIERRVDIELEAMDSQYDALRRTLDPSRFTIRGAGERGHAAKQMEALDNAYDTLRDPLRRGRYWLNLHQKEFEAEQTGNVMVTELQHELATAAEPGQCDRVAHKAGIALEEGIIGLLQALRGQDWHQANAALVELDGLEIILGNVRSRRTQLAPESGSNDGLTSVK